MLRFLGFTLSSFTAGVLVAGAVAAGCSGDGASATDAPDDGGTPGDSASEGDGGTPSNPTDDGRDASTDPDASVDAGPLGCMPTPGTKTTNLSCDEIRVAVLAQSGKATRLRIHGRMSPGKGICGRVDSIIIGPESAPLQTIQVNNEIGSSTRTLLADALADANVETLCSDETRRFEPFEFIAKGRIDGGTFTAKCGKSATSGHWPPTVVLTCNENLEEAPAFASARVSGGGMFQSSSLGVSWPHPPGAGAVTALDASVRFVPFAAPFSPPIGSGPFTSSGWNVSVQQTNITGQDWSNGSFDKLGEAFDTTVCPAPDPNPNGNPAPLMMAQITGTSALGAFKSEALVEYCDRTP